MTSFNIEWILGFALGIDYLSQIDVSESDGSEVVDVIRVQLGVICLYFPVK